MSTTKFLDFRRPFFFAPILILLISLISCPVFAFPPTGTFSDYLDTIKEEASKAGVSSATINKYLGNMRPPVTVKKSVYIKEQTHEAAKVLTFEEYTAQFIPHDINYGAQQLIKHYSLLKEIEKIYHVQPRFIISLWGIESDYGRYTGDFPLVRSLAILGYHHHRADFYQQQLIDALIMLDRPKIIPEQLKSAWDGGMGQPQFEPSTYLAYAIDFDKDGFSNIWTSLPDVFASIANFLKQHGWNGQETWGIPVKLPKNFPMDQTGLTVKKPITYWKQLGVIQENGKPLPSIKGDTSILSPSGKEGTAYLIYPNFSVLLRWNDIFFEGLSVGILSDKIAKKAGLPQ